MDNLKKVIEAEAEKQKYRGDFPVTHEQAFIQGCNFMAGHLEGLLEWAGDNGYMISRSNMVYHTVQPPMNYSQLIDKYFNELNSKG